jgi:hypothetical protein
VLVVVLALSAWGYSALGTVRRDATVRMRVVPGVARLLTGPRRTSSTRLAAEARLLASRPVLYGALQRLPVPPADAPQLLAETRATRPGVRIRTDARTQELVLTVHANSVGLARALATTFVSSFQAEFLRPIVAEVDPVGKNAQVFVTRAPRPSPPPAGIVPAGLALLAVALAVGLLLVRRPAAHLA